MALSDEAKEKMRIETHGAALVLADDLRHIRTVLRKKFPTAGDVRRLCAQLRRILLERQITAVAAPRVGRIRFEVPYSPRFMESADRSDCVFATATIPKIFGVTHRGFIGIASSPSSNLRDATMAEAILRLDGFLADKVIWAEGQWVTRQDILKFVAYHDYGVHFTGKKEPIFDVIRRNKRTFTMSVDHKAKENCW